MKKLISMMLMLCAIITFSACSSSDDDPVNPVSNPVVPTSAKIGSEVTVQGSGFAAGQTLYLQSENSEAVDVNAKMSSNGATFTIPYSMTEGKVNVVLKNGNDSWTLGSMTLLAAENPISAMALPSELALGKEATIAGIGFVDGDRVLLTPIAKTRMQMEKDESIAATVTSDGLKFTVPAGIEENNYEVALVRGKSSWSLGTTYIYQPRQIESITISDNAMMKMYSGMIGLTDDALVLNLAYNEKGMLSAITANASMAWQLNYDGKTVTCDAYTYTLDDQNRIIASTRQDYDYNMGEMVESKYIWSYDANGYLVSVKKEGIESDDNNFVASYGNGNLNGYTMSFENQLTTANNNLHVCPATVEPAYLINTFAWLMQRDDLFLGFLINQNVKVSTFVPTQFIAGDMDPNTGADIQTSADIVSSFKDNVLTLQTAGAAIAPSQMYYANSVAVKYKNK